MKVAIYHTGSTLQHVHTPDCADLRKSFYRRLEPAWTIDVESLKDLTHNVYPPEDFEYDGESEWKSYSEDLKLYPCVKLPETREVSA